MTTTDLSPGFAALKEQLSDRYDLSEPLPLHDAAALLREVADLAADLSLVRSSLEEQLAAQMEEDRVETPHGVLLRRYKPIAPKWDSRRLAFAVTSRIAPADEDGQPYEPAELIDRTTEELIAVGGLDRASHSWKKTELKARGIDFKSYCETDGWKTTVGWE